MDKTSQDRLSKVHPELASRIAKVIDRLEKAGRDVRVVQGLRTYAEQDALYAQGRTRKGPVVTKARGGYSNHNFGLAVDLCPFTNGKPNWNDGAGFNAIGAEGKRAGLKWGGDWKFVDKPHLELPGPDLQTCRTLYAKGGLSAVWNNSAVDSPTARTKPDSQPTVNSPEQPPFHIVQKGETLSAIAKKYCVTVAELQRHNAITDPNKLSVGQKLRVK